jgi:hypothetical protein
MWGSRVHEGAEEGVLLGLAANEASVREVAIMADDLRDH